MERHSRRNEEGSRPHKERDREERKDRDSHRHTERKRSRSRSRDRGSRKHEHREHRHSKHKRSRSRSRSRSGSEERRHRHRSSHHGSGRDRERDRDEGHRRRRSHSRSRSPSKSSSDEEERLEGLAASMMEEEKEKSGKTEASEGFLGSSFLASSKVNADRMDWMQKPVLFSAIGKDRGSSSGAAGGATGQEKKDKDSVSAAAAGHTGPSSSSAGPAGPGLSILVPGGAETSSSSSAIAAPAVEWRAGTGAGTGAPAGSGAGGTPSLAAAEGLSTSAGTAATASWRAKIAQRYSGLSPAAQASPTVGAAALAVPGAAPSSYAGRNAAGLQPLQTSQAAMAAAGMPAFLTPGSSGLTSGVSAASQPLAFSFPGTAGLEGVSGAGSRALGTAAAPVASWKKSTAAPAVGGGGEAEGSNEASPALGTASAASASAVQSSGGAVQQTQKKEDAQEQEVHAPAAAPAAASLAAPPTATAATQQHLSLPTAAAAPLPAAPAPIKKDLNKLHAAAMRAGMLGDTAKRDSLLKEIEEAKKAQQEEQQQRQQQQQQAQQQAAAPVTTAPPPPALPSYPVDSTGMVLSSSVQKRLAASASSLSAAGAATASASSFNPTASEAPASTNGRGRQVQIVEEVVSVLNSKGMPIPSLSSGTAAELDRDDLRLGNRAGKKRAAFNFFQGEGEGAAGEGGGAGGGADAEPSSTASAGPSGTLHPSKPLLAPKGPERTALLPEDVKYAQASIQELMRQEAMQERSLDSQLAHNLTRAGRGSMKRLAAALGGGGGSSAGADEEDAGALEDLGRLASTGEAGLTAKAQQERDRSRAIAAHERQKKQLSTCKLCFDSPQMQRSLILSLGDNCLLMLPPEGQLFPNHCILVPLQHVPSSTAAEEECYQEMNAFKAALHSMFAAEGEDVLFLETAMGLQQGWRHCRIDVVPMDKELAFDAPMFFKKAISESEEWTTHKQLIDTAGKGLRRCIPKGFPYFHVGWKGGGMLHAIEEESSFPQDFGLDICAGMLGLPPARMQRTKQQQRQMDQRFQQQQAQAQRQALFSFLKMWEPFDPFAGEAEEGQPEGGAAAAGGSSAAGGAALDGGAAGR